jgi:hypothetical protein
MQNDPTPAEQARIEYEAWMSNALDISADEAESLTKLIKAKLEGIFDQMYEVEQLILEAHDRRAWQALGYSTWEQYVKEEFDLSRSRSYQLLDQARVVQILRDAASEAASKPRTRPLTSYADPTPINISARDVQRLKPQLPAAQAEVRELVSEGAPPAQAIQTVVERSGKALDAEEKQSARKRTQESYVEFDADGRFNPHEQHVMEVADAIRHLGEFHSLGPSYKALVEAFKPMVSQPKPEGVHAAIAWENMKNHFEDIEGYVDDALAYLQEVKALLPRSSNGPASPSAE